MVTIALALKQLDNVIFVNIVKHEDGEHLENVACADCDISITKVRIREFAKVMQTLFQGRTFPIPLLYDMHLHEVVSTESDVILRFLNDLFNEYSGNPDLNLVPDYPAVAAELDMVESQLLGQINRCIGDAAQAHAKETFDTASRNLHEGLKEMNDKLGERFFLCGDEITEADLIEFVALYRYDPLLSSVFTVDDKKILIQDAYPHIWTWLQRIYNMPGVAGTCDLYEVFNSRSFQRTFGIRIKELGVEFALDWEEQYIAKLALDDRPYVGGDDDGDEVEEQEAGENGHANKKRKL